MILILIVETTKRTLHPVLGPLPGDSDSVSAGWFVQEEIGKAKTQTQTVVVCIRFGVRGGGESAQKKPLLWHCNSSVSTYAH